MGAIKLKQPEATYIEEVQEQEEESILFNHNHRIWPVCFWAIFLIIVALMGMGVVTG